MPPMQGTDKCSICTNSRKWRVNVKPEAFRPFELTGARRHGVGPARRMRHCEPRLTE
jgi:hypothetical protein